MVEDFVCFLLLNFLKYPFFGGGGGVMQRDVVGSQRQTTNKSQLFSKTKILSRN
jgi:hypothetical protein